MMIKEKEACDDRRLETFTLENRQELDRVIRELKQLKTVESNGSHFCDGVTPSLERQLKKVLKVYNYSFACS